MELCWLKDTDSYKNSREVWSPISETSIYRLSMSRSPLLAYCSLPLNRNKTCRLKIKIWLRFSRNAIKDLLNLDPEHNRLVVRYDRSLRRWVRRKWTCSPSMIRTSRRCNKIHHFKFFFPWKLDQCSHLFRHRWNNCSPGRKVCIVK